MYRRIADTFVDIGHRIMYSGKMVGDCLDRDIRNISSGLPGHGGTLPRADEQGSDLIGGIAADTDFYSGLRAWNESSDPYTLRSGLDSGRIKFHDFYKYVEHNELPEHIGPLTSEGSDWTINRAWGRAIAAKRDHLHEQGIAGRDFSQAMWKWQDDMERQARELDGELDFPAETRSREPHLGRLYRGDSRPKETIFEEGFRPRGTIDEPTWSWTGHDGPGADDRVCTSRAPAQAARFPLGDDGETFVVRDTRNAHDRGEDGKGAREQLVVVDGGIPADKVEGVLIDRHDPDKGFIPNPDFRPEEPTPVRPPREDSGWDNMVVEPS
ncbi:hypothetical protein [Nocardia grenadensis]